MDNEFFEWTVKIKIHKDWVADGYEITENRLANMIASEIPFSREHEMLVQIISKPDEKSIRKIQGYDDDS